ncbi:MAG: FtsX-like permease family protein [Cyclobacteriaceae bacterium]
MLWPTDVYPRRISIKVSGAIAPIVAEVRKVYEKFFPGNEFNYYFADDYYNRMYRSDLRFGVLFTIASAFAIGVACLGLFGLATFMVRQRAREIGIRKVLGATAAGIAQLLSMQFGRLLLVAVIVAIPLSAWVTDLWLQRYPLRAEFTAWMFGGPVLVLALLAWMSVAMQVYRGARTNPAHVLRA